MGNLASTLSPLTGTVTGGLGDPGLGNTGLDSGAGFDTGTDDGFPDFCIPYGGACSFGQSDFDVFDTACCAGLTCYQFSSANGGTTGICISDLDDTTLQSVFTTVVTPTVIPVTSISSTSFDEVFPTIVTTNSVPDYSYSYSYSSLDGLSDSTAVTATIPVDTSTLAETLYSLSATTVFIPTPTVSFGIVSDGGSVTPTVTIPLSIDVTIVPSTLSTSYYVGTILGGGNANNGGGNSDDNSFGAVGK